jgi:hypothetical protein
VSSSADERHNDPRSIDSAAARLRRGGGSLTARCPGVYSLTIRSCPGIARSTMARDCADNGLGHRSEIVSRITNEMDCMTVMNIQMKVIESGEILLQLSNRC